MSLLWALAGEGAAGAGAGGGGSEGAAAAYGGGRATQCATTWAYLGGLADGAAGIAILVQLDDIDICAEGFGFAGDGVAAIGGLNEGVAQIPVFSADSLTEVGGGSGGRNGIRGGGGSDVRTLRWQRGGNKKR